MTKRSPKLETAILDGFADGVPLIQQCRANGVSRTSFYRWKKKDPDLARRYAEAQADHADAVEDDSLVIAHSALSVPLSLAADVERPATIRERIWYARMLIDTHLKIARNHRKKRLDMLLEMAAAAQSSPASASADTPGATSTAAPLSSAPLDRAALLAQARARLGGG